MLQVFALGELIGGADVELFAWELRHQIDIALGDIRDAERAADEAARDAGRGRLADLVEIADRHGLTSVTQLVPQQCVPVSS
jgi:hypothetical protein